MNAAPALPLRGMASGAATYLGKVGGHDASVMIVPLVGHPFGADGVQSKEFP